MKNLIITAIIAIVMLAAPAFAVPVATDFTLDWSGYGTVTGTFNSGDDAVASMQTSGNTAGTFYAVDTGIAPYSYGVDDSSAWMRGDITNGGGTLNFNYARTDSYEGMYGSAGQWSNSFVGSTGTGSLDFRTSSNYASLVSSEYNWQTNGQFQASGSLFEISHTLQSGDPDNWGSMSVVGSGSAVVDYMADGYTGGDGFRFGSGDGCYTNADILTTGNGQAVVHGQGDSYLSAYDGSWTMPLGGIYSSTWNYNSGLAVNNFAFSGN